MGGGGNGLGFQGVFKVGGKTLKEQPAGLSLSSLLTPARLIWHSIQKLNYETMTLGFCGLGTKPTPFRSSFDENVFRFSLKSCSED